jgi:lipoate-protein ligase B
VNVARWGRVEYARLDAARSSSWDGGRAARSPDLIVAVEHPPVITLGRHAPTDDLLCDRDALARRGSRSYEATAAAVPRTTGPDRP